MTARAPTLGAVVLPTRGGARLATALAAVDWADTRAVVVTDPRLIDGVPPDVRRLEDPCDTSGVGTDWVLMLEEDERLAAGGADSLRAAIAGSDGHHAFALPVVTTFLDMAVELRRPLPRVGPAGSPIAVRRGLSVELATRGRGTRLLDVKILRHRGDTLDEAVELLGADAGALSALVEAPGGRGWGMVWQPAVAAVRALVARASGRPLGIGRWVLAVFEGYRVVVAQARSWERRRDRVVVDA